MNQSLQAYISASTANPLGRRPWGYKLSAYDARQRYLSQYYRANFAVPNPNEVGEPIQNPTVTAGLGAAFNKPGGIAQARWASRDNFNAPLPIYGAPELTRNRFSRGGMGLIVANDPSGPAAVGPIYYAGQSSPQPVNIPAPPVQTTLPQPVVTPASVAPATPPVAISSSGAPMSTGTPATTTPVVASTNSIANLYAQTMTWLQSKTLISSVPNYVPVGAAVAALFLMSGRKGRR